MLRKVLWSGLVAILLVAMLVVPASAGGNSGAGAAGGSVAGSWYDYPTFYGPEEWATYVATGTGSRVGAATADCCIPGDMWGALLWGGQGRFAFTVSPGGADQFGPVASVANRWAVVVVQYYGGVDIWPAGLTVYFETDGSEISVQRLH